MLPIDISVVLFASAFNAVVNGLVQMRFIHGSTLITDWRLGWLTKPVIFCYSLAHILSMYFFFRAFLQVTSIDWLRPAAEKMGPGAVVLIILFAAFMLGAAATSVLTFSGQLEERDPRALRHMRAKEQASNMCLYFSLVSAAIFNIVAILMLLHNAYALVLFLVFLLSCVGFCIWQFREGPAEVLPGNVLDVVGGMRVFTAEMTTIMFGGTGFLLTLGILGNGLLNFG
jgi:hypothetical protein